MSVLTVNTSASGGLQEGNPATPNSYLYICPPGSSSQRRNVVARFDFSALPVGAIRSSATLTFNKSNLIGNYNGYVVGAYEITQTAWVAAEVTWNSYSSGSSWSAGGGDYTSTDHAEASMSATTNWDVKALVQHFQSAHGKIANFLMRDTGSWSADNIGTLSSGQLAVTYSLPSAPQIMIF